MTVNILNFSGYILDKNLNLAPGAVWTPNSDGAIVYKSFTAALMVGMGIQGPVAIYRVEGPSVECTDFNQGKYSIPKTARLCIAKSASKEMTKGR